MTFSEIVQQFRTGHTNMFALLYPLLLDNAAQEMEVFPGEEFKAAHDRFLQLSPREEASSARRDVCLGDRPVAVTLNRLWM